MAGLASWKAAVAQAGHRNRYAPAPSAAQVRTVTSSGPNRTTPQRGHSALIEVTVSGSALAWPCLSQDDGVRRGSRKGPEWRRSPRRPPTSPEKTGPVALITFAHRGARSHLPENTLPAFRYALEHGARGLETDARRSADGEVVLAHDEWLWARVAGIVPWRRRVPATSAQRLGTPRLVDLYDELGSDYELSIDLKAPDIGPQIISLARERGDPDRLWLCAGSVRGLRELREDAVEVKLVHSQPRSRLPHTIERHAADLAAARIDAMNLHHSEWSRGLVELFHRFDVQAFAWDVQEVRHLRAMLSIGIDAVYCDNVDRMVATAAEWTTDGPSSPGRGDER